MSKDVFKKKIDSFGFWESQWLKKQVEGHVVFGTIYRYVPCFLLGGVTLILVLVWNIFTSEGVALQTAADFIWYILIAGFFIYQAFILAKYQQAVICWLAIKVSFGIAAFVLLTVGTLTSLSKHQSDALPNFLIGVIWMPEIEFIPKMSQYQKYISVLRLLLTVPVVYLGIKSGYWTWE